MDEINTPFTTADQTLAFALAWLVTEPVYHVGDVQLALAVLEDVLPVVNREHPIVTRLALSADRLVAVGGAGQQFNGTSWASAQFDGRRAVAEFAKWRAGRSYDVFKQEPQQKRGAAAQAAE